MIEILSGGKEIELMETCCVCWCSCSDIFTHCDNNHNEWLPNYKVKFPQM